MSEAQRIHAASLVVDTHADTPQRFVDEGWSFTDPVGTGMLNLDTARAGNLAAEFFAIWAEPVEWRGRYAFRTLQLIDGVYEQVRKHPTALRLGLTPDDILQAYADGVFCALLGIEGGHSIENDLGLLRLYTNEWADSSGDLEDAAIQHHGGLTGFGREVVREMNRLGMMVDVSHVADSTFWDVLQTTHAPIIASHSSARALTDSPRNLTDEQLRAIATNDGVVMVNFYPAFIDDAWRIAWKASSAERDTLYEAAAAPFRQRNEPVPYTALLAVDRAFYEQTFSARHRLPQLSALIDHFDHVAQVAGIDHVGIGSDFDGFPLLPQGLASAADLPSITAALHERGYTAEQLRKLLGGNLMRVFAEVQAHAAKE
jgi:membrane dipeptidase